MVAFATGEKNNSKPHQSEASEYCEPIYILHPQVHQAGQHYYHVKDVPRALKVMTAHCHQLQDGLYGEYTSKNLETEGSKVRLGYCNPVVFCTRWASPFHLTFLLLNCVFLFSFRALYFFLLNCLLLLLHTLKSGFAKAIFRFL